MRNHQIELPRRRPFRRPSRRLRPVLSGCLIPLEERTLLSTTVLTVSTFNDVVDGNVSDDAALIAHPGTDGKISLREAVEAASNDPNSTEIDLPAGTYNLSLSTNLSGASSDELVVGGINPNPQTITFQGIGGQAVINQTVAGDRIMDLDYAGSATLTGNGGLTVGLTSLTLQGVTNASASFGGGAIIGGGFSNDTLTLSSCVVQNNSTLATGLGEPGAGIQWGDGGNLTISGSRFSNNVAQGSDLSGNAGGAINFFSDPGDLGVLTVSDSTFADNAVSGSGAGGGYAGGAIEFAGSSDSSITSSTFTSNSAGPDPTSTGGAIDSTAPGNLNIVDSRFFGNSASSGGAINNAATTITANNNWWGVNAFPAATGTDSVNTAGGTTAIASRLALVLGASPTSTSTGGGTSTLTMKVVSTSAPTVAVSGTALDGLNVAFAPGLSGATVNPAIVAIADGAASSTFTAGATSGTAHPTVNLDNGSATTSITVAAGPTANSQSVSVLHATAKAITLTGSDPNSPPQALTFAINTNPSHGTLSGFNSSTGAVTYTPSPPSFAGTDTFTFTVTNTSGQTSAAATVTLNVAAAAPTANSQSVNTNQNTPVNITLTGSDPNTPTQALTYAITASPTNGVLSGFNSSTGAVTYTPSTSSFIGTDTFQFDVTNSSGVTSAAATVTVHVNPAAQAAVTQTSVSWGSVSAPLFTVGGALLPAGRHTDLPWLNINRIGITLSQAEPLAPGDVTINGITVANYGPVTITPSSGSHTQYTIGFKPIAQPDVITLTIGNAGITTFTRTISVLPGDFNDDGVVNSADVLGVSRATVSPGLYIIIADIDGDGTITIAGDVQAVRSRIGNKLPV